MNARQFRNQYARDHNHIDWDCMVDDTKLSDLPALEDDVMEKYKATSLVGEQEEELTEHNTNVVSQFMHHCKNEGYNLPDHLFESFFGA